MLSNQYQYQTGDKLPEGTYVCMQCADNPQTVIVPEMCEHLPECPHCGCTYWYKV
ncbi:MAG: zinc ribbon-containing protein [[Clostridium] leptum]